MMPDFTLSKHAIERILDMAVEPEEIVAAFERPRDEHRSGLTGALYLTRGRVTLVVAEGPVVVTVLWAKPSGWAADSGRGGFGVAGANMGVSRAAVKARRRNRGQ